MVAKYSDLCSSSEVFDCPAQEPSRSCQGLFGSANGSGMLTKKTLGPSCITSSCNQRQEPQFLSAQCLPKPRPLVVQLFDLLAATESLASNVSATCDKIIQHTDTKSKGGASSPLSLIYNRLLLEDVKNKTKKMKYQVSSIRRARLCPSKDHKSSMLGQTVEGPVTHLVAATTTK